MTHHPVDVHVGRMIRHRRWMTGATQQQLAAECGIKFQQIQKYENGANRCSASRLWDIAKALDAPVGWFFQGLEGAAEEPREELLITNKETAQLVRAYRTISPELRPAVLDLVRTLAEHEAGKAAA